MARRTTALLLAAGVCVLALATVVARSCWQHPFREEYERFASIKEGMTETEVLRRFGQPYRIYRRDTAPANYYVDGWSYEERKISNKVLIYIASEPIAYIYIDKEGVVEHVFVGGS